MHLAKIIPAAASLLICAALTAQSPYNYDDGLQRSTPEAEGVRSEAIADVFKALDEGGYEVHGLMILRHDKVIAEHWWYPYGPQYLHSMYSATKSFTGTAIGFAVQEGLLDVEDKVISFFPELVPPVISPELAELSVKHLLTMSAGHRSTQYPGSGLEQVRSFLAMDYAHKPGTSFAYNITCSHVLSNIITRVTGLSIYEYLRPRLFDPLGLSEDIVWEMDLEGHNMGNGGMHSRTSDLAKFGLFLKNKGMYDGKQVINRQWVEDMTTPHIFQRPELSEEENMKDDGGQGYGYQVWMGRHNSYRAIGGQNQLILVIPDQDLVIVSNGSIGDEAGFNQIMYDFADTVSDKKLKANKSFDLNAAIAGYRYKAPFGPGDASAALKSCTLRYKMHQNSYGIDDLMFRFDAKGNCTVTLVAAGAIHNIPFGLDDWKVGATDRTMIFARSAYPNPMDVTPYTAAGYCTWTAPGELSAHCISMFNAATSETVKFSFAEGTDTVTMTVLGPAPRTRPGAPAAAPQSAVLTGTRVKTTL